MKESADALNNQAIKLAHDGNFSDAIACISRAIMIDRNNYLLWFNLGITYRDMGKLKEAKDALEKAYGKDSEDEEVIESLALACYDLGEYKEALVYCHKGLELNEENAHLWNTTGVCYFAMNQEKDAAEAFEVAVMINPYYYDALFNLRDTYAELGNTSGVEEMEKMMKALDNSSKGNK